MPSARGTADRTQRGGWSELITHLAILSDHKILHKLHTHYIHAGFGVNDCGQFSLIDWINSKFSIAASYRVAIF